MICRIQDVKICEAAPAIPNLPRDWKLVGTMLMAAGEATVYEHKMSTLKVLYSIDDFGDGKKVLHVSVSRRSNLPSWEDLKRCKTIFMGPDVDAFHIIPRASDHVNLHSFTMHLWAPWEESNDS